jgi:uncharacterized membrane protein
MLRTVVIALSIAYPILAHTAVALESVPLTVLALGLLAAAMLLPSLQQGSVAGWLTLLVVGAGCWWLARTDSALLPLYLPPVLFPAFLGWVFGHTLAAGRTPLISQLIRILHASGPSPEPAVWAYARKLTFAWTAFFATLAVVNLVLAAITVPAGLLVEAGFVPPVSVSPETWSLFANVIGNVLAAAFFAVEYAYRRRRFPQQPYRNMVDFVRQMAAASTRLFERGDRP